jgi:Zn-dependent protease
MIGDFAYLASVWVVPVLFAVTFHEAGHAWVAWRLGDDTARRLGRVSFNPFRHVDPFGTVLLPGLLLVLSGGRIMFGYAKPVPVNFARLGRPRRDMILVALAGPGTNLLLAAASAFLAHFLDMLPPAAAQWGADTLQRSLTLNLVLAVFNMLPLLPLDGGRVLVGLLPPVLAIPLARTERFGMVLLIGLLFLLPTVGNAIGLRLDLFELVIWPPVELLYSLILVLTGHV